MIDFVKHIVQRRSLCEIRFPTNKNEVKIDIVEIHLIFKRMHWKILLDSRTRKSATLGQGQYKKIVKVNQ